MRKKQACAKRLSRDYWEDLPVLRALWPVFLQRTPCYTLIMQSSKELKDPKEFDPQPQLRKGFRLSGQVANKPLVPPALPEPIFDDEELPEELGAEYSARHQENILAFKRPNKEKPFP